MLNGYIFVKIRIYTGFFFRVNKKDNSIGDYWQPFWRWG